MALSLIASGFCRVAVMAVFLLAGIEFASPTQAGAQINNTAPILGSTGGVHPSVISPFNNPTQNAAQRHLDYAGKPCLAVEGRSEPQRMNDRIFDHKIEAKNHCSQPITIDVCYYRSQRCVPLMTPGYRQSEVVLGIMPTSPDFRFEFRERFN